MLNERIFDLVIRQVNIDKAIQELSVLNLTRVQLTKLCKEYNVYNGRKQNKKQMIEHFVQSVK